MLLGWRATENASLRREDLLSDGFVRLSAKVSKTRSYMYGWLPEELHSELLSRCADRWAFGCFADELRRLLRDVKGQPHHAAKVKSFSASDWSLGCKTNYNRITQVKLAR